MSKERAQRRAEREREAAVKAAARARETERRARSAARKRSLTGWLPRPHLMPGTLAARRRREVAATIAILVALNVVVWIVRPDWSGPPRRPRRLRPRRPDPPPLRPPKLSWLEWFVELAEWLDELARR